MSATIEQQYNYNKNIHNAGKDGFMSRLFITHGFDLAHPEAIQEAITNKRIIPFARVKETRTKY